MDVLPILSTLRRHRTTATLIVLEIALTCAIVCNAIFLIGERLARMDRPSGVVDSELLRIQLTGIGKTADAAAVTTQDLAALRAIPGVRSAAATNMVPFGGSSWNTSLSASSNDPDPLTNVALYLASPGLIETLGVRLVAGRDFLPEEYTELDAPSQSAALITRGLAERLFPGKNPLGQPLYISSPEPQIVVGIIDHLARPNDFGGAPAARYAVVIPVHVPYTVGGTYVVRADPSRRAEVLAAIDAALDKVDPNRIVLARQPFSALRDEYFEQDRSMAYLLVGVSLALLVVTALGIVGLASFWVQQRTRQIGIRRALGATRRDIVRLFQLENFILATIGIAIGMALAFGINLWLMDKYQVARLPAHFLPLGAALLWLLGQLAVLGPALRASAIPPAIATRTV
ncbi:MAG: ABC transporter permease [Kofleriaceae bacterium]